MNEFSDVATPKRKVSREEVYSTPLEFGKGGENLAENWLKISLESVLNIENVWLKMSKTRKILKTRYFY